MKNSARPQIPACAWTRSIGLGWEKPYTVRYASNLDDGPWHGMPLGGFGAGCVGRSHRGDFNLWHIDGGEHWFESMPACQFSLFEQVAGEAGRAIALCTEAAQDGSLGAWHWLGTGDQGLGDREQPPPNSQPLTPNPSKGSYHAGCYHALYPRSWFAYENGLAAKLTCEQFSPIWADNYQETSYPIAIFNWTIQNPIDRPITLSILLSWQNMVGWFTNTLKSPDVKMRDDGSPVYEYQPRIRESAGNLNRLVQEGNRIGCILDGNFQTAAEGDGQWAIATQAENAELFYHTRWNPAGDGGDLWQPFSQDGSLANIANETAAVQGEQIGAAIAVRITLAPGEVRSIPFVLAWDFPVTEFAQGVIDFRRYTDFFGRSGKNAWAIAQAGLDHYQEWRQQICDWQQPICDRVDLPDWFKMALFNELYDLTQGGTLWSAASDRDSIGRFAVLECLDYRWYESLDVRLYGSFALLMLWPELDKAVLRSFARAIPQSDDRTRVIGYYFVQKMESPHALRKAKDATPHDLGAPNEHPWEQTNYTSYQDCNQWKDLGSDFVLQVYRDFVLTGSTDVEFLAECWEAIALTLAYLKTFDHDQDGIPENSGAPDQTFDDWRLQGVSAYCGGLWLAALEAAIAIGRILVDAGFPRESSIRGDIATYETWLAKSRPVYATLWNGQYYRLDTKSGSDVVMADQLCGQFYARLLGLPDIVPPEQVRSSLKTIYEACFLKFHAGKFGAANGLRPDGTPLNPNDTHPLEVWTGINFGLAAFLHQMDMPEEAMRLTEAVVRQIYDNGLQFRTPEAITAAGTFRASHYLRAMAIWGILLVKG